jgi:flagellar motor protein MotB
LGLTLAEVLLLLLFLLMLVLAGWMSRLRKDLDVAQATIAVLHANALDRDTSPDPARLDVIAKLAKALGDNDIDIRELLSAVEDDSLVDPSDPPADLRASLEFRSEILKKLKERGFDSLTATQIAEQAIAGASVSNKGEHDWPPIINLTEADGYFFNSGSAELSPAFRKLVSGPVADQLLEIVSKYDVNVIEVVGHTDEQPLAPRYSNLDQTLFGALRGGDAAKLDPADNAGLGMARAVAVANLLMQDQRLSTFRILPLSGAQLIDHDRLASGSGGDVQERRRIEIRVRRSEDQLQGTAASTISPVGQ